MDPEQIDEYARRFHSIKEDYGHFEMKLNYVEFTTLTNVLIETGTAGSNLQMEISEYVSTMLMDAYLAGCITNQDDAPKQAAVSVDPGDMFLMLGILRSRIETGDDDITVGFRENVYDSVVDKLPDEFVATVEDIDGEM